MKTMWGKTCQLLAFILVVFSVVLGITTLAPAVEYEYTELLPSGAIGSSASVINNSVAVVVVGDYGNGFTKLFIYSEGVYTELPPLGWGLSEVSAINDINDSGAVVGEVYDGTTTAGFLYSEGVYTKMLPQGWGLSEAHGINNSGVVVGTGHDGTSDKGFIAIPITTPLEQMQSLIEFFDNGVADGSLSGNGLFSKLKLKRFRGMLLQAQALIESGNTDGACQLLTKAYMRVDGNTLPRDYVMGSAAPNLAAKIDALIKSLNCS